MISWDFWDKYSAKLGPYGMQVYMCLVRHADKEGMHFPSVARIAEQTGISINQVTRELKKLEKIGLISVSRNKGERNFYLLQII